MLINEKIMVTGGAGFIGHHLVSELLKYDIKKVIVVDDLSTGLKSNLANFITDNRFEFIQADISKNELTQKFPDVDYIFNLAALVSVPLSFQESGMNNNINIVGFQNILEYAKTVRAKKVIYASSSAVYGNTNKLPIKECTELNPTSPYGFSKYLNEIYAAGYKKYFNICSNGFRFFNVYGEGQRNDSPYSGVISIFKEKMLKGEPITIYGDGEQTRDFVFVKDLVKILIASIEINNTADIYNIGTGKSTSINQLFQTMAELFNYNLKPNYREAREGDIKDSLADIKKLQNEFGNIANTTIDNGLKFLKND